MNALSPYARHAFVGTSTNNSWSNMLSFIPDGSRVLDVGCSTGKFGEALTLHKNCTSIGVDLNAADIAEAVTRLDAAYVFDITQPNAQEILGTFDVVVFGDVVEHLPDPRAVLAAVHLLLKPEGFIVYSIPNMGHLSVRLDALEGRFAYTEIGLLDKTHLHFYDRPEVQSVFEDSGFLLTDELPTIVGYPDKWVAQRLDALGLAASSPFFSMLRGTDADVFQFVGVAIPTSSKGNHRRDPASFVMPQDEMLQKSNELIVENERLEGQLRMLHEKINRIRNRPFAAVMRELRRRIGRVRA